jgi:hypothetical protein
MKRIAATMGLATVLVVCATALASVALSGTYTTVIGKGPLGGKVAGNWSLAFSGSKYTVSEGSTAVVNGTFTLRSNRITFTDKSGKLACPGKGVYKYTASGRSLKFKRISDSNAKCAGRRAVLAGTYTKKFSSSGSGGGY